MDFDDQSMNIDPDFCWDFYNAWYAKKKIYIQIVFEYSFHDIKVPSTVMEEFHSNFEAIWPGLWWLDYI